VRGQHAGIEIVGVPGREPDDNPDGLAFIKRRLSVKIRKTNKIKTSENPIARIFIKDLPS